MQAACPSPPHNWWQSLTFCRRSCCRMGCLGRHLEPIIRFQCAGRSASYEEVKVTFHSIAGHDAGMRRPRNDHSRFYFSFHIYRHITRHRAVVRDRIFRVTPGVVAIGVPWPEALFAMNPVSPQIAQDAEPARSRRVNINGLPSFSDPQCPEFRERYRNGFGIARARAGDPGMV
jgi:hypothetical protein